MADTLANSQTFQGVAAAPGMSLGPVFVWRKTAYQIERRLGCDPQLERQRLDSAISNAQVQIEALRAGLEAEGHPDEAAVFGAHAMLVNDRSLLKRVTAALNTGLNAEAAWADAVEIFANQLAALPDPTLRLRAADLRDVGERVGRILAGAPLAAAAELRQPAVILAEDLTPSETVTLDKRLVLAFCTAQGGPTSHTAILAKALGLPAVVSLGSQVLQLAPGTLVLVDGGSGQVVANPSPAARQAFEAKASQSAQRAQADLAQAHAPAVTQDGIRVEIVANIGGLEDAGRAVEFGAEGVGLFRTEFMFLQRRSSPDEDEQYAAYRPVFEKLSGRPIVVRTIDAGGDKEVPYLADGVEANPFLGWRAIRLCLAQPDFFKEQLRALLRAGAGHDLRIMFPMIATLEEIRQARVLLNEAKAELAQRGEPYNDQPQVGIMVEIPSAAILAPVLAKAVDFFSIGTNDLTQYTLAADRTNHKLAHLSDHCHPAVLHLIRQTARAAHAAGIWVGVCGEMAGDPEAIPLLVGLGIDELSMSPALIPPAKSLIRRWEQGAARQLAEQALAQDSAAAVRRTVRNWAI